MSSSAGSRPPSGSGAPVARAALVTHGRTEQVGDEVERLVAVAEVGCRAARRAGRGGASRLTPRGDTASADLVVVLGGRRDDASCPAELPRLGRARDRGQLGRVGFLSSMQPDEMETGLTRAFRDVTSTSSSCRPRGLQRRGWPCRRQRRVVASADSPRWSSWSGRSAARTSAACPATGSSARRRRVDCLQPLERRAVLVRASTPATTFVAPHSLHARPLVVPRGKSSSS